MGLWLMLVVRKKTWHDFESINITSDVAAARFGGSLRSDGLTYSAVLPKEIWLGS